MKGKIIVYHSDCADVIKNSYNMIATIIAGIAAAKAIANNSFLVGSVYSGVPALGKNQHTNITRYVRTNVKIMLTMSSPREKKGGNGVLFIIAHRCNESWKSSPAFKPQRHAVTTTPHLFLFDQASLLSNEA